MHNSLSELTSGANICREDTFAVGKMKTGAWSLISFIVMNTLADDLRPSLLPPTPAESFATIVSI